MQLEPTPLAGAFLIDHQRVVDERGFFAREFSSSEFAGRGLAPSMVDSNLSFNARRGTLRGMHWQAAPHQEAKLVTCVSGAMFDVIVDLRRGSPTLFKWWGAELSGDKGCSLYIPVGFAHGYVTLTDRVLIHYLMSAPYHPESARGFRHDDPTVAIRWPEPINVISPRDLNHAPLDPRTLE
jgi:dTDP-4-dehydrorhamnose 3,5-epimerase